MPRLESNTKFDQLVEFVDETLMSLHESNSSEDEYKVEGRKMRNLVHATYLMRKWNNRKQRLADYIKGHYWDECGMIPLFVESMLSDRARYP